MSSSARQYHPRSPRYTLRPEDESQMRFACMHTRGFSTRAKIQDLSETGLAICLSGSFEGLPPEEGDMLKIEFTVPGRKQIACFATVMRLEERSDWDPELGDRQTRLIALQFRNLPTAHHLAIQKSLQNRVRPEEEFDWSRDRRQHLLAFGGFSLALLVSFYIMTQPYAHWLTMLRFQ